MSRLGLCLSLVLVANLVSQADESHRYDKVPQASAEEAEAQRDAKRAFLQRTVRDMYEKAGDKNPRWDADARNALDAVCRFWLHGQPCWDAELAWDHAADAIKAGCSDPLIKYLYIHLAPPELPKGMTDAQIIDYYLATAGQLDKSGYPPARKAVAWVKAALIMHARGPKGEPDKDKMKTCLEAALRHLPAVLADKNPYAQAEAYDLCTEVIQASQLAYGDRKFGFDNVMDRLRRDPDLKKLALLVQGHFYVKYAWDARGNGFAPTVTEEGAKDMAARLQEAESALEAAWKLAPHGQNPLDAWIAKNMITTELGQGQGRERMELWFQRAMKADSDNAAACYAKMYYLTPKWYGSAEDMVEFGRACFETQNWEGRLPFLRSIAREEEAKYLGDAERTKFFHSPEVRADIKAVYSAYLQKHPDDKYRRSEYFRACVLMGELADAQQQLKILGRYPSRLSMTRGQYAEFKVMLKQLEAEELAKKPAGPEPTGPWAHLDTSRATVMDGFLRVKGQDSIATRTSYSGPIDITAVARTDKFNIRLYAGKGAAVIFNWEGNPKELQVRRPDGKNKAGSGSQVSCAVEPLAVNTWYTLHWRLTEEGMEISVNDKVVFTEKRKYDLSAASVVTITPRHKGKQGGESTIDVKSFSVKPIGGGAGK